MMEQIEEFLENTPKDIYEFSIILEDMLVDDYYEMWIYVNTLNTKS